MKCLWGKNVEVLDTITFLLREFNSFQAGSQSRRSTDQLSPIRNRDCLRLSFNAIIKIDLPVVCPHSYNTALQQIPTVNLSQNNKLSKAPYNFYSFFLHIFYALHCFYPFSLHSLSVRKQEKLQYRMCLSPFSPES